MGDIDQKQEQSILEETKTAGEKNSQINFMTNIFWKITSLKQEQNAHPPPLSPYIYGIIMKNSNWVGK